jgi:hypothetical protein
METLDQFVYVVDQIGAGGLEGEETAPPIGLGLGRDTSERKARTARRFCILEKW